MQATRKAPFRFRERSELLDFLLEVSAVTTSTLDLDQLLPNVAEIVQAGGDVGRDERLAGYVAARRRDQTGTALFTDFLTRVFSNPLLPIRVLRNAGLLSLHLIPPLRHALMRHNLGLAGRLPRLARGVSLL